MLVLDCFIPELILSIVRGAVCVYLGTSPDYGWSYAFLSAAIVMVIGLITLITKHSLGPIGDSPLLDQTSKRTTKEIAVYGALISIPLIFIMIKNTDYTDYFMYAIGPLAILYFLYETLKRKRKHHGRN
jgi:POT family proton-dependent oligopeptide transporter